MLHTSRTCFPYIYIYNVQNGNFNTPYAFCRPRELRRHYNFNDFIVIKFRITCTIKSDLDFCNSSTNGSFVVYSLI